MTFSHKCQKCGGRGQFLVLPDTFPTCDVCAGTGKVLRPIKVKMNLDAGLGPSTRGVTNVTLYPNGDVGFRPARKKTEVRYPLSSVYSLALKAAALAARVQDRKTGAERHRRIR